MPAPRLGNSLKSARRVLCLGAHCDDIEIGCGGTILRLLREAPGCEIHWRVFSSTLIRKREAVKSAALFLAGAKSKKLMIRSYDDSYFPSLYRHIKVDFEKLKKEFAPDLVLTHYRYDLHQDHRVICELTWNTFRSHLILEYEIPKYDGDLGAPNFFVALDRETCERKADFICRSFASQRDKHWFTAKTFLALTRLRSIESNAPHRFSEGFHCRKLVL